jgi:hypothetical protein
MPVAEAVTAREILRLVFGSPHPGEGGGAGGAAQSSSSSSGWWLNGRGVSPLGLPQSTYENGSSINTPPGQLHPQHNHLVGGT